jgi:hypothetical protein
VAPPPPHTQTAQQGASRRFPKERRRMRFPRVLLARENPPCGMGDFALSPDCLHLVSQSCSVDSLGELLAMHSPVSASTRRRRLVELAQVWWWWLFLVTIPSASGRPGPVDACVHGRQREPAPWLRLVPWPVVMFESRGGGSRDSPRNRQ